MSVLKILKSNSKKLVVAGALALAGLSFGAAPASAQEYNGPVLDKSNNDRSEFRRKGRNGNQHRHERNRSARNGGGLYIEFGNQRRRHRHARRVCSPRRALDKAWNMGVNRPYVDRVGRGKIVVKGRSHGHRAKVVFKRHSRHCRVIKVRGLRRYH